MKKKKKSIIIFVLSLFPLFAVAQGNESKHELVFDLMDNITTLGLPKRSNVYLLSKDSVLLYTGIVKKKIRKHVEMFYYSLPVDSAGDYILKCENEDYHTLYKPINVKLHKREHEISLGKIGMKRRLINDMTVELEGVEVVGTKLKFYYDNDTLIYKAANFVTQEGFVLSEMLKKMPGIEVRDDGNIYSNGEQVSALLLNGKDFFQSDRKTLLENLPAFIVKDVKVYNKTKDSLSLFKREREFEGLVMDVKLKKDYYRNRIANIDVAAGTDNGYYAKLFGMDFSLLHKLIVFGGTNNMNRNEDLKEGEHATNRDSGIGRTKYTKSGLNYNVDHSQGKYTLNGGVTFDYTDQDAEMTGSNRLFSASGDLFSRSLKKEGLYSLRMDTNHELNLWENSSYSLTLKPSFSHMRSKDNLYSAQGTFRANLDSLYGDKWIDSLTAIALGTQMLQYGISRQMTQNKNEVELTGAKLEATQTIQIPHTDDQFFLTAEALYNNSKTKAYRMDLIDYMGTMPTESDKNYHYSNSDINQWKLRGATEYHLKFTPDNILKIKVDYEHMETDTQKPVFLLQDMDNLIGSSLDIANSYNHTLTDNNLLATLRYEYTIRKTSDPMNSKITSFFAEIPFKIKHSRLYFSQNQTNETVRANMACPDIEMGFSYNRQGMKGINMSLNYKQEHDMASPLQMIDIYDDTNPLMMMHGNRDLKNPVKQTLSLSAFYNNMMKWNQFIAVSYVVVKNAITDAILFNRNTGAWNVTPMNTNGNRTFSVVNSVNFYLPHQWSLQNNLTFLWANLSSYSGMSFDEFGEKSLSHMHRLSEEITVNKMSSNMKHRISLTAFVHYNHTGNSKYIQKHLEDWEYGLKGNVTTELPWNLKFENNLVATMRRGYAFSSLNSSDYVWNMELRKAFNEKVLLKLEANDLLNQRQFVTHIATSQMETENLYNHLGRYVMFHFIYKFAKGK